MAASRSLSRRGGSGSRTLLAVSPGRSAANATSISLLPAIARTQTPTARLNGSVGASFAGVLDLIFVLIGRASLVVVSAEASVRPSHRFHWSALPPDRDGQCRQDRLPPEIRRT